MAAHARIALVTGANRGIGYEIVRQLASKGMTVILSARDAAKGQAAAERLASQVGEGKVLFRQLDVADSRSLRGFCESIAREFGRVDVLVNNAGVFLDKSGHSSGVVERMRTTMETNVYGPYQLCEFFVPLMVKNGYGRVVNISSGMGQLSEMNGGYPAYRISKTALNAVTRIFADESQGADVLVNSVCPGWVKTDMGGAGAERSVEQGADTPVWLATLPKGGPTGGFFRDREPIAW